MLDSLGTYGTLIGILGLLLVVFLVAVAIVKRYKVAGPDEAFIVTGRKGKSAVDLTGQKVVAGGGVFVLPFVQQLHVVELSSRRISVQIRGAVSKQGIKLNLDGIAIVKVGGDEGSIRAAAQRFLSQQDEIELFTTETLAGALRSIVGTLSVEEIIRDRASFAAQVSDVTESALTNQGLVLDTFQIQDVTDDGSYLADLGRPEAARVNQEASVAEAAATRVAEQARIAAEGQVLEAQRALAIQRAQVKAETDAASATADAAGPLAEAAKAQEVLAEQEKVAQRRAALTDRELDSQVRKPADAARYKMEQEAEGESNAAQMRAAASKAATIAAAEAQSREDELSGAGQLARRTALAEALRVEGAAQAEAALAVGTAEAEAMNLKASAYANYSNAAVMEMLIKALPDIAHELAAPMAAIDNLTIVSTEGAGALPRQVTSNMAQLQEMVKSTLGVDLSDILKRFERGNGAQSADAAGTDIVVGTPVTS